MKVGPGLPERGANLTEATSLPFPATAPCVTLWRHAKGSLSLDSKNLGTIRGQDILLTRIAMTFSAHTHITSLMYLIKTYYVLLLITGAGRMRVDFALWVLNNCTKDFVQQM